MKIIFTKDCGHRPEGLILDSEPAHAAQYIAGGFAEHYIQPPPAPPAPVAQPVEEEGLSEKIMEVLIGAGYEDLPSAVAASDEELLAVKGIGKAALKQIRELGEPAKE